jgi:regulator of replication initiation timing
MADLTSRDVQQAVQTAIRNLESNVQRLNNDMNTLTNQLQAISTMAQDIQIMRTNLQQNLGTTADSISFQSAPNMSNLENTITQIQSDVQDLKNQSS